MELGATAKRYALIVIFTVLTLASFGLLIKFAYCHSWEAATVFATLFVGVLAADVVIWQGYLIKRQLAFSTYLDLDKEWNEEEMIDARKTVHAPGSEEWDDSRLEAILEFFEKVGTLFKTSGDTQLFYGSTLGWYAAHYFLFAREHGQIAHLRELWQDKLYEDVESFYMFYLRRDAGLGKRAKRNWELKRLTTEAKFWEQERKD
jgi:hypothetical protein